VERLGRVAYAEALRIQEARVEARKACRIPDTLLLLEHDPVFTLGRNARPENLLVPPSVLESRGFALFETGRGGDVTYHGPGQVVGYPILELPPDRRDVHRYVRDLEEVLIRTLAHYGVTGSRIPGLTGVWVGDEKVAAIGVRISRWVTSHGFALNVTNDLSPFGLVVPCGIREKGVTSLARLLADPPETGDVMTLLGEHLAGVFARSLAPS
jgi:lipoyl(octanoyl) transferase